jgi:hypothetical protein
MACSNTLNAKSPAHLFDFNPPALLYFTGHLNPIMKAQLYIPSFKINNLLHTYIPTRPPPAPLYSVHTILDTHHPGHLRHTHPILYHRSLIPACHPAHPPPSWPLPACLSNRYYRPLDPPNTPFWRPTILAIMSSAIFKPSILLADSTNCCRSSFGGSALTPPG